MKSKRTITFAVFIVFSCQIYVIGQTGMTVQFVARGFHANPKEIVEGGSSAGHVFMIITVQTAHGPKEDAYGFYPAKGSLRGVIKGPGMLKSEYSCNAEDDCNPDQYAKFLKKVSESKESSAQIPIDANDRQRIFQEIYHWNEKEYRFLTNNCIDFASSVLKDIGFPSPSRNQTPEMYLKKLQPLVQQELARREAVRAELENQARLQRDEEAAAAQADNVRWGRVLGNWVDTNGGLFSTSRSGDNLVFNSPGWRTGTGRFTGELSFSMSWPQVGAYTARISADGKRIDWSNGIVWRRR
jgi:hypothetical protein